MGQTEKAFIKSILDKKAEESNTIDLDAYASGLEDMHKAIKASNKADEKYKGIVEVVYLDEIALATEYGKELLKRLYPDEFRLCKTWREFMSKHFIDEGILHSDMPFKYKAAYKLELLRNHYNGGSNMNHCAYIYSSLLRHGVATSFRDDKYFLNFKNTKLAKQFLSNFKELIIEAGDII